jgi:tRNA (cmo5U34)-methyltransferase
MINETLRNFDNAAASWDEKPQRRLLAEAVANGIDRSIHLNQNLHVLEYGCGTGLTGLQLATKVGHLTAVDTSAGMLEELRKKCQAIGQDNVTTILISPEGWAPHAATFDLIFSSMVLHHVAETEPLLRQFEQTLKPGGFLALADLEQEDGTFHDDPTGVAHHGFNSKKLIAILELLGFTDLTTRIVHKISKQHGQSNSTYPIFLITGQKPL